MSEVVVFSFIYVLNHKAWTTKRVKVPIHFMWYNWIVKAHINYSGQIGVIKPCLEIYTRASRAGLTFQWRNVKPLPDFKLNKHHVFRLNMYIKVSTLLLECCCVAKWIDIYTLASFRKEELHNILTSRMFKLRCLHWLTLPLVAFF